MVHSYSFTLKLVGWEFVGGAAEDVGAAMAARDWRHDPIGADGNEGVIEVNFEKILFRKLLV